jgi:hypothetical protein
MIALVSGANTVRVTLSEKAILATPYYYFLFVNDNTGEKFMCYNTYTTIEDTLQQFTITVQASPAWYSGEVELSKYGDYHYYAYEGGVPDPIGFDYAAFIAADIDTYVPTYFTTLVETGKMEFSGAAQTINTYVNTVTSVKAYGD